jgi:protein CpxP
MNKTRWITMAAALTLTATMAVAAPHEGGKMRGHGRGHQRGGAAFSPRLAEKLNLSDAQKQQIRDLQKSFREQNRATFEGSRDLRQQFREAKKANDTAKVDALKPQLEAQRTQMKAARKAQHEQILALLTPEQRTQLEALKAERKARRENRGK